MNELGLSINDARKLDLLRRREIDVSFITNVKANFGVIHLSGKKK